MTADDPAWPREPKPEAEAEYIELEEDEYADPGPPDTFPSGDTLRSDRRDAQVAHEPDRPPTPGEEEVAPVGVDPAVAAAYEDAAERGAKARGEGRVEPGRPS